jgi:hypothetical protein
MKHSKADVHDKARAALVLRFEAQHLTSFSGLIIFQQLLARLRLKARLWDCFRHLAVSPIYGHRVIVMLLVVRIRTPFATGYAKDHRRVISIDLS